MPEEEPAGHAAKGVLGKILAAHLGPLPMPLVLAGGAAALVAGYLYYKNRGASSTAAQPVAVPVNSPGSGGSSGGGGAPGPDYSAQLAALTGELTTLQGSFAGLNTTLSSLQSAEQQQAAALAGLQAQLPATLAAAQQPAQNPYIPAYTPPITSISNPFAQQSNLGSASSQAYQNFYAQNFLPGGANYATQAKQYAPLQAPYVYNNPIAYTGPTGPGGYNIPVYKPLPQYAGPQAQSWATAYSYGPMVPSSTFGSGANAFKVSGAYVTYPNGQQIWVAG